MPTRKQRRRREKELRHEYDFVWEDSEGNVVEVDDPESGTSSGKQTASRPSRRPGRGGRRIEPPSWRRTLRRGVIFAPIMLATVFLLTPKLSIQGKILNTALLLAVFIPFSYLLDNFFWRSQQRRDARKQAAGKRG
jgi:hypothetical protein